MPGDPAASNREDLGLRRMSVVLEPVAVDARYLKVWKATKDIERHAVAEQSSKDLRTRSASPLAVKRA